MSQLRLKAYHRAELRTSDHRPVYAIFEATVREIDESRKEAITKEIVREIRKSGPMDNTVDEKIERGLESGIGGLVKEMTHSRSYRCTMLVRQAVTSDKISHHHAQSDPSDPHTAAESATSYTGSPDTVNTPSR